uniref:hypothetical protein n=1 Tax=unclassified Brucella TaxID=2632610 RepID=UPI003B9874F1
MTNDTDKPSLEESGKEPSTAVSDPQPIEITGRRMFPHYTPEPLTATNPNADSAVNRIYWTYYPASSGPEQIITFDPNVSEVSDNQASTKVTVSGRNILTYTPIIYARADNPNVPSGERFFWVTEVDDPPAGNTLSIVSLNGNPLKANEPHLLRATYQVTATAAPLAGQTVNWAIVPPVAGVSVNPQQTTTQTDGTTRTSIQYTGSGTASATVKATAGGTDVATFIVDFAQTAPYLPGYTNKLALESLDGMHGLPTNTPHKLKCTYTGFYGQSVGRTIGVYWYASDDRLTFSGGSGESAWGQPAAGNVSYTDAAGVATIDVTASGGAAIDNAVIGALGSWNAYMGTYDHSEPNLELSFVPVPTVKGIVIDKAYAQLPPASNPPRKRFPFALIECQLQVENGT